MMGIDPGTANLGFGVIRIEGGHMVALDGGVIETSSSTPIEERLAHIHSSLAELLRWHRPSALAIEDLFFGKNIGSAISVGQASGVAMKSSVCGSGNAAKRQVQKMVATRLNLSEPPRPDHAADALAVAICHGGTVGLRDATAAVSASRDDATLRVAS